MLDKLGFLDPADKLYVSSSLGLIKWTGSLFKHVLEQEKIEAENLHHTGDNYESDYKAARQLGINATHYRGSDSNHFERSAQDSLDADPELRSLYMGIPNSIRLANNLGAFEYGEALHDVAASSVAPLFTDFVNWVIQEARREGIERLYFLSRDGQTFYRIAQELTDPDDSPELIYLEIARRALFLPLITTLDRATLDDIFSGSDYRLATLLQRLGFKSHEEVFNLLENHGYTGPGLEGSRLSTEEFQQFFEILQQPELSERVLQNAERHRQLFKGYAERKKLFAEGKFAIVDIGWCLNLQSMIRKLLTELDPSTELHAYHLGILDNRWNVSKAGFYRTRYLQQESPQLESRNTRYLNKCTGVIEDFFCFADHGTVKEYEKRDDGVWPVFNEPVLDPEVESLRNQFKDCLHQYAREFKYWELDRISLDSFKSIALENFIRFLKSPTSNEARAFITINRDEVSELPMATPLTFGHLFTILKAILKRQSPAPISTWGSGSMAISIFPIRWTYTFLNLLKENARSSRTIRKLMLAYMRFRS